MSYYDEVDFSIAKLNNEHQRCKNCDYKESTFCRKIFHPILDSDWCPNWKKIVDHPCNTKELVDHK